jgi:hypothetical protein
MIDVDVTDGSIVDRAFYNMWLSFNEFPYDAVLCTKIVTELTKFNGLFTYGSRYVTFDSNEDLVHFILTWV